MNLSDIFARNLHAIRIQKHLTQQMLARSACVSVSYISMLERGQRSPALETIELLAKALGVAPIALLRKAHS